MQETRINGRFRFEGFLAQGQFSEVYLATQVHTGEEFIIKMEAKSSNFPQIAFESSILRKLGQCKRIPELIWSGSDGEYNCLVLQKLGDDLKTVWKSKCGSRFSLRTSLVVFDQIVDIFDQMH